MLNEQLRIRAARRYALAEVNVADDFSEDMIGYAAAYLRMRGALLTLANDFTVWLAEIATESGPVPEYSDIPMDWNAALGHGRN